MYIQKIEISESEFKTILSTSQITNSDNLFESVNGKLKSLPTVTFNTKIIKSPFSVLITCYSENGQYATEIVTIQTYTSNDFLNLFNEY